MKFEGGKNQLMINPRLSEEEKQSLQELQLEFEKQFGTENYFLVPSSGSSKGVHQSIKLIALSSESILNSAKRVNLFLQATAADSWGLCLPEFHVAGLGVLARAYLSGSKVSKFVFDAVSLPMIIENNKINFLSLVPAQIYDLVQANVAAPANLKKVFVGGGILARSLREAAEKLNWPVVETYGMTESGSMIATRSQGEIFFKVLENVSVKTEADALMIKCNSLLTAVIQKIGLKISLIKFEKDDWYKTEDAVIVHEGPSLELLGRKSDYVKILGEGVSLAELRERLQVLALRAGILQNSVELIAVDDPRAGALIAIVFEASVADKDQSLVIEQFNSACRPYEKIVRSFVLRHIPRTDLGKLKSEELKSIIKE